MGLALLYGPAVLKDIALCLAPQHTMGAVQPVKQLSPLPPVQSLRPKYGECSIAFRAGLLKATSINSPCLILFMEPEPTMPCLNACRSLSMKPIVTVRLPA